MSIPDLSGDLFVTLNRNPFSKHIFNMDLVGTNVEWIPIRGALIIMNLN